jgi:putative ATP-dependent endonuclease of the OLD family
LAFPEVYFARFVLLVEGDSERIVIPLLAKAKGLLLDPSFVATVPLGGRHVVHFWNLLNQLSIPHATLLDLDLGRSGGGFGRVKTVIMQLLDRGVDRAELLELENGKILPDKDLAGMDKWASSNSDHLSPWVNDLRKHGVYFSEPLDLDMAMLAAFPKAYETIIAKGGGPAMKPDDAAKVVLGDGGNGVADYKGDLESFKDLMPAYRYHFLTRSKPATHMQALSRLTDKELAEGMPKVYASLLKHIDANLDRE